MIRKMYEYSATFRSLRVPHPLAQHGDRSFYSLCPGFVAFRRRDPLGILASMREGERLEARLRLGVSLQRGGECRRHLDLAWGLVALDLDLDAVTRLDAARGLAYLAPQAEVGDSPVDHQPAAEGRSVDGPRGRRPRLAELRLRVERDDHAALAELRGEARHGYRASDSGCSSSSRTRARNCAPSAP